MIDPSTYPSEFSQLADLAQNLFLLPIDDLAVMNDALRSHAQEGAAAPTIGLSTLVDQLELIEAAQMFRESVRTIVAHAAVHGRTVLS